MSRQEITLYVIIGVILFVFAVSGYIMERRDKRKQQAEERAFRHIYDEDKQQMTDDLQSAYQELMFNEIWKGGI